MLTAARILRAVCLAGIAVGISVALIVSVRDDAGADVAPTATTTTMPATAPVRLGQAAVGLSGPIGAGVEGTTATARVPGWPHPTWPKLGWPDIDVSRLVLSVVAVGCLFVVAVVRI